MTPVAFDTETCLIRPALLAPPMVCATYQRPGQEPGIVHVTDAKPRIKSWLTDPDTLIVGHFVAYDMAVTCAQFPDLTPLVFAAYKAGRVTCTKKRQQLLDIAGGVFRGRPGEKGRWIVHEYHLADLAKRFLNETMQKDGWRLSYSEFLDVPIAKWPERARGLQEQSADRLHEIQFAIASSPDHARELQEAYASEIKNLEAILNDVPEGVIRYPLEDARVTLAVYQAQEKHAEFLKDQYRQAYADFVLYLSSCWGLRTYAPGVEALKSELEEAQAELSDELKAAGFVREDGTRNMKAVKTAMIHACSDLGIPIRRTDGHYKKDPEGQCCDDGLGDACTDHVSLDSDACEAVVASYIEHNGDLEDFPLGNYAEFVTLGKMLNNDVKMLEGGTVYPVHTRYDLAETGRTTSSKPNIQNLNTGRVKNKNSTAQRLRPGVRQAFIPRPGKVFVAADFPQLELFTLAQCCYSWLGFSKLGDMLNAGMDPHTAFAAQLLGIPYEEALRRYEAGDEEVVNARQIGKAFNFGRPGGMGKQKFKVAARKMYGVVLTDEQWDLYDRSWHTTLPEMKPYFARHAALFGDGVERASVETLFTERHRGGATYCAANNNGFQALGIDCAKAALCLVAEAEYVNTKSPLYGTRTSAFVHDELIGETEDNANAHDAAFELARLMSEGANRYLPNVPIPAKRIKPLLMRRWSKKAKQVFDTNGRLVPWDIS